MECAPILHFPTRAFLAPFFGRPKCGIRAEGSSGLSHLPPCSSQPGAPPPPPSGITRNHGHTKGEAASVPALPVCPVAARFPSQGLPQLRTGARGKCGHARCSMSPWRPLNPILLFTLCRQQMQGSQDRVAECTTSNFDGMISMLRPDESWVAKWQRIGEFPLPTHTIHAYPPTLCSSFSLAYRLLACVLHRETAAGAVRGQGGGTASRRTGIVASGDGTNVLLLNASAPVRWW